MAGIASLATDSNRKKVSNISLTNSMETLDKDILNMIADFDEEIMRNEAEEDNFNAAMKHWELNAAMDDWFDV